ncbi:MAG TPA: hypothetical protein VIG47_04270, partial [Gemmatimonadaceae bacterium]
QVRDTYEALGEIVVDLAAVHDERDELRAQLEASRVDAAHRIETRDAEILGLNNQLDSVKDSTSWRVTRPLRSIADRLHPRP